MPTPAQPPDLSAKRALRDQVLEARRQRSTAESLLVAESITAHLLAWDVVRRSATVGLYVSVNREPGTRLLLDALRAAGTRVLLPVLRPDMDLDWAEFDGALEPTARGLLEPTGPRLGVEAITQADVVLAPGLAVSSVGDRLGYGGGCYDRALVRVGDGVPIGVLLHDDEADRDVPTEPHDRRVTHVVTQAGVASISPQPG